MQTPLSDKEGYGLAIMTTDKLIPGKTMKGHTGFGLWTLQRYVFSIPKKNLASL